MSTHEARYRGQLLGFHAGDEAARAYLREHHAGVQDKDQLTVEPRRPVELLCRGNLVDTFATRDDALEHIGKLHHESVQASKDMPLDVWEIVDRSKGEISAAERVSATDEAAVGPAPQAP